MSKQKTFRPPQDVLDLVSSGDSVGVEIQKDSPLSLGEVQRMYHHLSRTEGDLSGIRWARRILRQEGLLKASNQGDTQIPEAVDLQLGPEILSGVIHKSCEDVVTAMTEAGVPSSCLSVEEGTLVFFSKDERPVPDQLENAEFPVKECTLGDLELVDSSGSRLRSIVKFAGTRSSSVSCFSLPDPGTIAGLDLEELYLLKATDRTEYIAEVLKVDDTLGIVLGWAIICNTGVNISKGEEGEPYFDKQGDHIPEYSMLEATTDFMLHSRKAGEMHWKDKDGEAIGKGVVVFCWPMTAEIAKAFGIETKQTGLMIAMKPEEDEILEKFRTGEYKGFSIGGNYIPEHTEEVE
jgi:hypothetical protein